MSVQKAARGLRNHWGMFILTILLLPLLTASIGSPLFLGSPGHCRAYPVYDSVGCWDWPEGFTLNLFVDDDWDIENGTLYTSAPQFPEPVDGSTHTWFDLAGEFDLTTGQRLTVSDGANPITTTVANLGIDGIDVDADLIWGTSDPDGITSVHIWDGASMDVSVQPDGSWTADFSAIYDFYPGLNGDVENWNPTGTFATNIEWHVPNPVFFIDLQSFWLWGEDWPVNTELTITIDGGAVFTTWSDPNGHFDLGDLAGYPVAPGTTIEVSGGAFYKTHTVADLVVSGVNPTSDTISGTAAPGLEFHTYIHHPDAPWLYLTAAVDGSWTADYGGIFDVQPYDTGAAEWSDEDGDSSVFYWHVPNPLLYLRPEADQVWGHDWTLNSEVTLTIDKPGTPESPDYIGTATVITAPWNPGESYVLFELGGVYDLEPNDDVTLSDGVQTKEHVVLGYQIHTIEAALDTVSGTAAPGSEVHLWICDDVDCANRHVTADAGGAWTADFSIPGPQEDEQITFDIRPGFSGDSNQFDADGDATFIGWQLPNARFQVQPQNDYVQGWEWPEGIPVTLTIDDPNTPETVDYIDTQVPFPPDWDPGQHIVEFSFGGSYDVKPGDIVQLDNGTITKIHTVSSLAFTNLDADLDQMTGTAEPEAQLQFWAHDDDWNLTLQADAGGNWLADLSQVGYDLQPGSNGAGIATDDDEDQTWVGWSISQPRITVSYEHDWISIDGFTPNGQATYTIYDHEGGNALFGPVTGPIDLHGSGWISSQLTHIDLVPGNLISVVDEISGEERSLLIRSVNLDYLDAADDIAYGTTEPFATIELNISQDHDSGFSLEVTADAAGNWWVDLAAAGQPIDTIRHADASLRDEDGDWVTAQQPRIVAQIGTDSIGTDNFSRNADVTMWLYNPDDALLYNDTLHSGSSGSVWVNLWELGIDLVPGMRIEAFDHQLGFTKELVVEDFSMDAFDVDNDLLHGTSLENEWVELHVESLFSNWGIDALTGPDLNWTGNYGAQGFDLTEQMWAYGWAIDDQGNWSEDHITGQPNLFASMQADWISGFNFSPDREVQIDIYDFEGGSLLATVFTGAGGDTQFQLDPNQHGINLQPGMFLLATDLETGKSAALTLTYLTFDGVNHDLDSAWGQAGPGAMVVIYANHLFDSYQLVVEAGESGWFADFAALGADLGPDWDLSAYIYDAELDATVANAPRPAAFQAELVWDWIAGDGWSSDNSVQVTIFPSSDPSETPLFGTAWVGTDHQGQFHLNLRDDYGFDLYPGLYVLVEDTSTGMRKTLTLVDIGFAGVDYLFNHAWGYAPAEERLNIRTHRGETGIDFDIYADEFGGWLADFGAFDFDLGHQHWIELLHRDADGDATSTSWYYNPTITASTWNDWVNGDAWMPGSEVWVTIDDPGQGPGPEYSDSRIADPNGYFQIWNPIDFEPGFIVTMSDGAITKTLEVSPLAVTGIDVGNDVVSGVASPNAELQFWVHGWDMVPLTADSTGAWSIDTSGFADIRPGQDGSVKELDGDRDETHTDWYALNPHFTVYADSEYVEGGEWPLYTWIHLSVFEGDPESTPPIWEADALSEPAPWDPSQTYVSFDLQPFDIHPGHIVILESEDGTIVKTHTVVDLQVLSVDEENETVSGTGDPDAHLQVDAWRMNDGAWREVQSDQNGDWLADFSNPPEDYYDLGPGTDGSARQFDDDGDATAVNWGIANPTFSVRLTEGEIHGYMWPLNAIVNVSVFDFADPGTALFSQDSPVQMAPWNPDETFVVFRYADELEMQTGYLVVMTDGSRVKTHVVFRLDIDSINIEHDTVSGWTDPHVLVAVDVWGEGYASREVWADEFGFFIADFTVPGNEPWQQDLFDIVPGSSGEARINDQDYDTTHTGWYLESPPFCEAGDTVSGFVYESDGMTPIEGAEVVFADYVTGEPRYKVFSGEDGSYSCYLPDGDYRISAVAAGYSTEFYQEAIFENAAQMPVEMGTQYAGIDFTLDTPWVVVDYLFFNFEDPILGDPLVRQAIAYGTDRQRIIDATFPASPLLDSYLVPIHWGYTGEGLPEFRFDPDYSAALLESAGWLLNPERGVREKDGQLLEIAYLTTLGDLRATIGTIFAENMADLGIVIDFQALPDPWTPIFEEHAFGIAQFAYVIDLNTLEPGPWGTLLAGSDQNPGSYSNPAADAQLEAMADLFTVAERLPYMVEHQRLVMPDLPLFPLLWRLEGPADSDEDGIPDDVDACPAENPEGFDADGDGCTDTIEGLCALIAAMPPDQVDPKILNSLVAKCTNAMKSIEKENFNAAAGQLGALILELEAQSGQKVAEEAADRLMGYTQNVIALLPD